MKCKLIKILYNNQNSDYIDIKVNINDRDIRMHLDTTLSRRVKSKQLKLKKGDIIILSKYHEWYSTIGITIKEFVKGPIRKENKRYIIQDLKLKKEKEEEMKRRKSLKDIFKDLNIQESNLKDK